MSSWLNIDCDKSVCLKIKLICCLKIGGIEDETTMNEFFFNPYYDCKPVTTSLKWNWMIPRGCCLPLIIYLIISWLSCWTWFHFVIVVLVLARVSLTIRAMPCWCYYVHLAGCQGMWDIIACWPSARVGEVVTITCPPYFSYFSDHQKGKSFTFSLCKCTKQGITDVLYVLFRKITSSRRRKRTII